MGRNKISASSVSPKWVKSNERRREREGEKERKTDERKSVLTMVNTYANAWTNYALTILSITLKENIALLLSCSI